MIWMLLATYFLGGGLGGVHGSLLTAAALNELSDRAEVVITVESRAVTAKAVVKQLRKEVSRFERKFARSGRQLNRSYRRHEADREQAYAILHDLNEDWEIMQRRAIDLRFELRDAVTEEEWSQLFESQQPEPTL